MMTYNFKDKSLTVIQGMMKLYTERSVYSGLRIKQPPNNYSGHCINQPLVYSGLGINQPSVYIHR